MWLKKVFLSNIKLEKNTIIQNVKKAMEVKKKTQTISHLAEEVHGKSGLTKPSSLDV